MIDTCCSLLFLLFCKIFNINQNFKKQDVAIDKKVFNVFYSLIVVITRYDDTYC